MDQPVSSIITHYAIFDIDNVNGSFSEHSITASNNNDLTKFLIRMAADTRSSNSTRKCVFEENSIVKDNLINVLNNNNVDEFKKKIAIHLAICEKKSNVRYAHLNQPIKKGSLVIARIKVGGQESLIITKIDIEEFFHSQTLELNSGLPKEKGLLKSCLIDINNNSMTEYISLADSNKKLSSFWVNDFIGANYFRDDTENTTVAIRMILTSIASIARVSPQDHTQIRQNLFSYMNTASQYDHDDMIDHVIGSFVPESTDVDTTKIKTKLEALINKDKFDGNFEIDNGIVKDKGKRDYKLDNDIVLKANNDDSNIFYKEISGQPYVLIKTNTGYSQFKELTTSE
jgi:hypothetical protein